MKLQSVIRFLYPPQCLSCGVETTLDFALCGACWGETPFLSGLVCDSCGQPLVGAPGPEAAHCDTCLSHPPPWQRGRAAIAYEGVGRRLVLGLKHGDRSDLVPALAQWLAPLARELSDNETLLAPVPLHRRRLFLRRYNQSALIAHALGRICGLAHCPDLLMRRRATRPQEGMTREQRHENQSGAIAVSPKRKACIGGRPVLLLDDVMTSGATLSACAEASLAAGAGSVNVLVLARVARDTQIV